MEKKTVARFLAIKEEFFKKEGAEAKYNRLLNLCIGEGEDLIDNMLAMKFSMTQVILVIDVILAERKRAEETLYKSLLTQKAPTTIQ